MLKSAGSVWEGVNFWFTIDNLSLLWPIDTKLEVWETYTKSVMKVEVTVAKTENMFPVNNFSSANWH